MRRPWFLPVLSWLALAGGLSLGVILVQRQQRLFTQAWSGFKTNLGLLPSPEPTISTLPATAVSQSLYHKLVQTYPTAAAQAIVVPAQLSGLAYLYHDPLIDKSYVFSRLENVPYFTTRILRLWLENTNQQQPAGIAEFVQENGQTVAYSVFVQPGNVKQTYQKLVFSYDTSANPAQPETPFLNLDF